MTARRAVAQRSARRDAASRSRSRSRRRRWCRSSSARSCSSSACSSRRDRAWRAFHANWLFFAGALERRRDVRRRAAHHDGALVAPGDPVHGRLCRVSAGGVRVPAAHALRREGLHLPVDARGVSESRKGAVLQSDVPDDARHRHLRIDDGARALWYMYTSVRLDVGRVPERGAEVGGRDSARACALGSAKSVASSIRRTRCRASSPCSRCCCSAMGWSVLAWDLSMGAVVALPEHAVRLVVLHGRVALRR